MSRCFRGFLANRPFHGSFWGNYTDLSEVMVLAAQGKIRHTVKTITFDQINEYIGTPRDSEKIVGRAVINPDISSAPEIGTGSDP